MKPDRGLDVLNLLLAAAGAAYGAFIPVYLTAQSWTQTQIGVALTLGTVAGVAFLLPAGMLIDMARARRRRILAAAITLGAVAPLVLAAFPRQLPVYGAILLQAVAASIFAPAVAAISLCIAGQQGLSDRLGRNARFGSIGAGLGAALLGACSAWGGERGVFLLASALTLAALLALRRIRPDRPDAEHPGAAEPAPELRVMARLLHDRQVLVFAAAVALFQVASIAVIQLAAVEATRRVGARAGLVIAAFVIVPQLVVAWIAPLVGRLADRFGRRPVLFLGFATVPLRDSLFALIRNPVALVPVQTLEGVGGAVFGVMIPLLASDLTRGGGAYTTCLGLFNLASSIGTAISTALAGAIADRFGRPVAYGTLAMIGVAAAALLLFLRETRSRQPVAPGALTAEPRA